MSRLRLRGRTLEVELTPVATRYRVIDGGAMTIHHRGERLELRGGQELVMTDYDEAVGL
jgi:hypothetical protein